MHFSEWSLIFEKNISVHFDTSNCLVFTSILSSKNSSDSFGCKF